MGDKLLRHRGLQVALEEAVSKSLHTFELSTLRTERDPLNCPLILFLLLLLLMPPSQRPKKEDPATSLKTHRSLSVEFSSVRKLVSFIIFGDVGYQEGEGVRGRGRS